MMQNIPYSSLLDDPGKVLLSLSIHFLAGGTHIEWFLMAPLECCSIPNALYHSVTALVTQTSPLSMSKISVASSQMLP